MTNDRDAMDRPMNCIATFVAEDGEVTRARKCLHEMHTKKQSDATNGASSVRTISAPRDE